MKKIIIIPLLLTCFFSYSQQGRKERTKTLSGVYQFWDSTYFQNVSYSASASVVHLGLDTLVSSPTYGKLVRKTASGGTPTLQQVMTAGNSTSVNLLGTNIIASGDVWTDTKLLLKELTSAPTFQSGYVNLWAKDDGTLHYINDANLDFKIKRDTIQSKGAFLESPTSADTIDAWQTPVAITITSLKAILRGSSPSVTYNIGFGTNIQSPTAVFTADITCTSITTGCSNGSGFNDATIPAGSFIWIYTNASSGTIRSISFTINYTED